MDHLISARRPDQVIVNKKKKRKKKTCQIVNIVVPADHGWGGLEFKTTTIHRAVEVGLNTEKSPGDVTQTPVKNQQIELVWKIC